MKKIPLIYMVSLSLLAGCADSDKNALSPSANAHLNAVSPAAVDKKGKEGYLQRSYDNWVKEEWEPKTEEQTVEKSPDTAVSENTERTEKKERGIAAAGETQESNATQSADENASETYTLQHYVDKWERYREKTENNTSGPSNVEKLDAMPAIGGGK